VKIFAIGGWNRELPCRHIGHVTLIGFGLDVGRNLFLRGKVGRLEPVVDQPFELLIGRPAEPSFAVIGAQRRVDRR